MRLHHLAAFFGQDGQGSVSEGEVHPAGGHTAAQQLEQPLTVLRAYATTQGELTETFRLISEGVLKPWVAETLSLADAAQAHDRLERRDVAGRLVLAPNT